MSFVTALHCLWRHHSIYSIPWHQNRVTYNIPGSPQMRGIYLFEVINGLERSFPGIVEHVRLRHILDASQCSRCCECISHYENQQNSVCNTYITIVATQSRHQLLLHAVLFGHEGRRVKLQDKRTTEWHFLSPRSFLTWMLPQNILPSFPPNNVPNRKLTLHENTT